MLQTTNVHRLVLNDAILLFSQVIEMNCLAAYLNSKPKLLGSDPPGDWAVSARSVAPQTTLGMEQVAGIFFPFFLRIRKP